MAYDEDVAERVRQALAARSDVTEKRMFGGLAFLVGGHLAVAASGQGGLLARVDPGESERLVASDGVERMVMRGREMAGWLHVSPAACSGSALATWVERGVAAVARLPE